MDLTKAALLTPVLLQRVLASLEDKNNSATITYACVILGLRLISAQLNTFNLWYQRRAYERCRGELITMLYEKTLHRKILGAKQEVKQDQTNGHSNHEARATNGVNGGDIDATIKASPKSWLGRLNMSVRSVFTKSVQAQVKDDKDAASMGKILNLMRNDAYEIAQRFWEFSDIVTKPAGAIFATILIWRMLGWACLLGVVALAASQLLNIVIARF